MRFIALMMIILLMSSCAETKYVPVYIPEANITKQNNKSVEQVKCYQKYIIAQNTCTTLFKGEENGVDYQNKYQKCLTNQGFSYGKEACNY